MAITDSQKIDYLFKKVGYGVAKTDTAVVKSPSNESVASPLLIRGDGIWQQSASVPLTIPGSNSSVVTVYADTLSSTIQTVNDNTAGTNRTWKTGLTDWIDSSFGATYQVKVYSAATGNTAPQTYGTQLFADGTGIGDEWYFDYQSGVLNFAGNVLPTTSFTGNSIFVSGARYVGIKGYTTISNINFSNTTISTTGTNANLILSANGSGYIVSGNSIFSGITLSSTGYFSAGNIKLTNLANPVNLKDAVTLDYLNTAIYASNNRITLGDTSVTVVDTGANGRIEITVDGTLIGNITANVTKLYNTVNIGNISITNDTISSNSGSGNIILNAPGTGIVQVLGDDAFGLPAGVTSSRPGSPVTGYIRYNTDFGSAEIWSGTAWNVFNQPIYSQVITPTGLTNSYTLIGPSTSAGVIVNINGTVQQPDIAYHVVDNIITFTETPLISDIVELRLLTTGAAVTISMLASGNTLVNIGSGGNISTTVNNSLISVATASDFTVNGMIKSTSGGFTFPDGTVQLSAVYVVLDDISGTFDGYTTVFNLTQNAVMVNTIVDSKDLDVFINGRKLSPYIDRITFPWLIDYDSFKGFRVKNGQIILYRAPASSDEVSITYTHISTSRQTQQYPFTATTIALGD